MAISTNVLLNPPVTSFNFSARVSAFRSFLFSFSPDYLRHFLHLAF
jgi:hypothetical protein